MLEFDNIRQVAQAAHALQMEINATLAEHPSACNRCGSTKLNLLGRCICGGFVGPIPRCPGCGETIPPQHIRCQDSEGRDVCLACGDGVKPDNDDPEVFSYA